MSTPTVEKKYGLLAAVLVAVLSVFSVPGIAQAAPRTVLSDEEAISRLAQLDETAQVAETLKASPETLAIEVVNEIGAQGASDVISYVGEHSVDIKSNLEGSGFDSDTSVTPAAAFQCGKARAAAYLFGIWGTAICGATAAASVGALGIGCEVILMIGANELDWNRVC